MNFVTSTLSALVLGAASFSACAVPVAVFDNGSFVDTTSLDGAAESDTIQASLAAAGHSVTTFTSITAAGITASLAGISVLVLPEQEIGDLGDALDASARDAIKSFVSAGGGL